MLQVYAFHGTDFEEVYSKLNRFLGELAIIDVQIEQDDIRSNTKYYPDWDRTATTIEVCLDFTGSPAPHEIASQVGELHHAVLVGKSESLGSNQETQTEGETKPVASDNFDPFLDSDDLP